MTSLPNPFVFESARSPGAPVKAAGACSPLVPAAPFLPDDLSGSLPSGESEPPVMADAAADKSLSETTQRVVEYFSDYVTRRCMHKVSPPIKQVPRDIGAIGLDAVSRALAPHPRNLDDDPPPLFLRKPSPAFLRLLFQLARVRT